MEMDLEKKGALTKACLTLTWLASRGQRASLPSGKKTKVGALIPVNHKGLHQG